MATYEASPTPSRQPQNPPAPLTPAWLRAHFDSLPFPARTSALARYARTLAPGAYETLRQVLDHGDAADRHTALFLAVVRRDLERVAEALADPLLGRRARSAAIRLPVPEQALERVALSDIRAVRHDTYRLLRLSRRTALAAGLLPQVHARHGAREAAALLPACPPETVAEWLPRVEPAPGILNSLARTAPYAVAVHVTAQCARLPQHSTRRYRAVASLAARRDPRAALLLLERTPLLLTPAGVLSALSRPAEALAVLRTPHSAPGDRGRERLVPAGPLPPSLRRKLLALPAGDLAELAEHCRSTGRRPTASGRTDVTPDGLLGLLPPAERRRIVEKDTSATPRPVPALVNVLAALEPADRADLVRPWAVSGERRPWTLARAAQALPLAEGEPLLKALADNHRVQQRSLAWPALLVCAELEGDPEQFARIAADCERAWHDQDAVRRPALEQLAGAAGHLIAALPERVLRDAVLTTAQARDSTKGTVRAARRLLHRVVERAAATGRPDRAARAAGLLGELGTGPEQPDALPPLHVDETTARAVWTAIAPTALRRPEVGTVVAELLATRLTLLPELDAEARRLAVECDDPHLAARAAAVWVRPPRLREQRCAELIALDPTFVTVPVVLRTVTTRRTDLLAPVLAAVHEGLTGRLRPRRGAWTPCLAPGVAGRWLPVQRDAWEEHHARVVLDESAPLRVRTDAARLLRDPERLRALAQDAPQPVAAAALVALGDVQDRDAVALLLRHAGTGGVRGRAAMASVRRLIARLPDDDAVPLLAPVACAVDSPVGARKEAVRALADLPRRDAFQALLAAWDAPRQHRDVRVVLARALLPAIDRRDVADRLVGAVDETAVRDEVVHARVGLGATVPREAYAAFLVRLVETGAEDTVVAACQVLATWPGSGGADGLRALADALAAPARPRTVWDAVARQLVRLPPGPATESAFRDAFDALAARTADPHTRADALRRLHACAEYSDPGGGGEPSRVLDALAGTLEAVGLHADAARVSWDSAMVLVRDGEHDEDRWETVARQCEAGAGRMPARHSVPADLHRPRVRGALLAAARTLRARGTAVAGRLALDLVRAGGRAASWDEPWRAELDALRAHQDADTVVAALLVDPDGRARR
ncbi:hypothetical protein HLK59_04350 [Streptomyces sp. S3(2020)]|uniref:hypothetical protein n=1 Tax=Streptomyces sp. S3(2020) TaxID=2732044 RepID=UPI00148973FF|nr:hypothetical protein [Streptomyces sp. S3(2020)]NNN29600.1 hypothetical protein [Streptomyces sp. S3(2020)]